MSTEEKLVEQPPVKPKRVTKSGKPDMRSVTSKNNMKKAREVVKEIIKKGKKQVIEESEDESEDEEEFEILPKRAPKPEPKPEPETPSAKQPEPEPPKQRPAPEVPPEPTEHPLLKKIEELSKNFESLKSENLHLKEQVQNTTLSRYKSLSSLNRQMLLKF